MKARNENQLPVLKVSSKLFRSPQPDYNDLKQLQQRGLKAVINVRAEVEDSLYYCRELKLGYKHFPVVDWKVPTEEQMDEFLAFLENPENTPALVHCWAGVGRTGLFVTCHRVVLGMNPNDAIAASDAETPGLGMNQLQRDWVTQFARRRRA